MATEGSATRTIITEDVEIVGTVKASNGLHIDGKLSGDLACNSDVVIGKSANIKGNLNINSISVNGQINGNIVAKDRIELKAATRLVGDIKAKRLTVEDGVSFVGKAEVNPSGVPLTTGAAPEAGSQDMSGDADGKGKAGASFFGRK